MARHFAFPWAELQQDFALPARYREKQYLLGLVIAAPLYGVFYWRRLALPVTWTSLATVVFGVLAAAVPTLLYVAFNRNEYMLYESSFVRDFWHAMQSAPFPNGIRPFTKQLWDCFFAVPGSRFFIPDALPIPLPYYWFLLPGAVLALLIAAATFMSWR
jgi:hypothetical protein